MRVRRGQEPRNGGAVLTTARSRFVQSGPPHARSPPQWRGSLNDCPLWRQAAPGIPTRPPRNGGAVLTTARWCPPAARPAPDWARNGGAVLTTARFEAKPVSMDAFFPPQWRGSLNDCPLHDRAAYAKQLADPQWRGSLNDCPLTTSPSAACS